MTAMDSVKAKFDEYEYLLRLQTEKIEELVAENERLKAAGGAHAVLKTIYLDRDLPESLRAKAATAALPHQVPKLMPERAPLELEAAEVIPLEELVRVRKERQDKLEGLPWGPLKLSRNGNGADNGDEPSEPVDK